MVIDSTSQLLIICIQPVSKPVVKLGELDSLPQKKQIKYSFRIIKYQIIYYINIIRKGKFEIKVLIHAKFIENYLNLIPITPAHSNTSKLLKSYKVINVLDV